MTAPERTGGPVAATLTPVRTRWRPLLSVVLLVALAACATSTAGSVLPPAGLPRALHYGDHEEGGADLQMAGDIHPGDYVHLPARMLFDVDGATSPWFEWAPVGLKQREDGGWHLTSGGELLLGVHQRVFGAQAGGEGRAGWRPAVCVEAFLVSPHGGPRPARWQGVIEGQEGYFLRSSAELGSTTTSLAVNLGGGLAGRPGQTGKSGRLLGSLGLTQALPGTGLGYSTEVSRLGVETSWVHDPIDERTFGELNLGLSFWLGTMEMDLGYRRGLTSETHDDVFYLGFRTRAFDAFTL